MRGTGLDTLERGRKERKKERKKEEKEGENEREGGKECEKEGEGGGGRRGQTDKLIPRLSKTIRS